MDLHQLAKELRERQICQERWKDCEMSEADFRKILLEMPDERMVLTYCACPGGGEDHVPRDLGLAQYVKTIRSSGISSRIFRKSASDISQSFQRSWQICLSRNSFAN